MALIQANFVSGCLKRTVPIQVILPVDNPVQPGDKEPAKMPYKTLYLLHGIFGDHTDWVTKTRLRMWAEKKNLAVVMPAGENAFYVDQPDSNNLYSRFIGEELVETTRRMFPLSCKREDTFIGGLSMGGYGALHNGLKYYETFSHIAVLSGALHIFEEHVLPPIPHALNCFGDLAEAAKSDKNPRVQLEKLKKEQLPKIYLACGREDALYSANCLYRDLLQAKGAELRWESLPGDHDWNFWDMTIRQVLDWLPLDKE